MPNYAVIGLGFGDEGKGHVVDYIASNVENPLVVRFCGGPQAAHQVILADGTTHVFSHFGSGTLRKAPTYWSRFCPMNPIALHNELVDLQSKGINPTIFIDAKCPVITPYEVAASVARAKYKSHGTCAAGIYPVMKREQDGHHILFEDIYHPYILRDKINLLRRPYYDELPYCSKEIMDFYSCCAYLTSKNYVRKAPELPFFVGGNQAHPQPYYKYTLIFEGAQGLMLDQNYGYFPHVTPANTGLTNIRELLPKGALWPEICLVTRSYQTRHGAGPMSPSIPLNTRPNPVENNRDDGAQGEFRKTVLDADLLNYAVMKMLPLEYVETKLFLNHLDLWEGDLQLQESGQCFTYKTEDEFVEAVRDAVGAKDVFRSYGPTAEQIKTDSYL